MGKRLDLLFIEPGNERKRIYQGLGEHHAAIQPPFLAALTADFIRRKGYSVGILDANAENLTHEETAEKISETDPRLTNIVVYGHQAATCTPLMDGVGKLCKEIKLREPWREVILTGWHPSALPERTVKEESCDYVCQGEGFYTLLGVLQGHEKKKIPGLWWKERGETKHTERAKNIENLTEELSGVAWDLLPMDKYRGHDWPSFGRTNNPGEYAAIFTTLGCPFNCRFCSIHSLFGEKRSRHWSTDWVLNQVDKLVERYGIKNLRIIDELFVLNPKHYMPIAKGLIERNHNLNIWAFTRVDTVKEEYLEQFKKAGFNGLGVGIESGTEKIRREVEKGSFKQDKITEVVRKIENAGITLCPNYIFGLPEDNLDSMQKTLDLALELLCCSTFFFSAMADPGSDLYYEAKKKGWKLPDSWLGYAQQSYECQPLPTNYVSAEEVLRFRDYAFNTYHTNPRYLHKLESKFGKEVRKYMEEKTKIKLKRKLLGD